jgi:hypothetical protein
LARSRKAKESLEPDVSPAVHAAPAAGSVRTVQTTRREFQEPISQPQELELETEPAEEDDLETFLSQIEADQGYTLRIERLPSFPQDGKTGIRAERQFVCAIPFDRNTALNYESDIQSTYGGGDYQFQLKRGLVIIKSWRCHIARPMTRPGDVQPVHHQVSNGGVQASAPVDPTKAFRDQMTFMKEFVALSKELNPAPPTGAAPAAMDPAVAEMNGKMSIIEKLIAQPENPLSSQIISKLLGTSDDSSWAGVVETILQEIVAPAMPVIGQIIMARMAGVNPFAAVQQGPAPAAIGEGTGDAPQQGQSAGPPAGQAVPSGQPGPVPVPSESQRAVQRILGRCISDCNNGFDSAGVIDDLLNVENDPAVGADTMAVATLQALIHQDPRFIATRVPPLNNERGIAWLTQFQIDWRAKTEPVPAGEGGTDAQGSNVESTGELTEQGL